MAMATAQVGRASAAPRVTLAVAELLLLVCDKAHTEAESEHRETGTATGPHCDVGAQQAWWSGTETGSCRTAVGSHTWPELPCAPRTTMSLGYLNVSLSSENIIRSRVSCFLQLERI